MKSMYILFLLLILSSASHAESFKCTTSVNGKLKSLKYDISDPKLYDDKNYSMREALFSGWGDIDCPSYITLRHLTPGLSDSQRSIICLKFDKKRNTYTGIVNGERDAYLNCKIPTKTFCERVNDSKDAAIALTGVGAGTVAGATTTAGLAGVTAVAHSSGAYILTGATGYIAGTYGVAAGTLAVVTAPAAITAAVASAAAVGGAVYYCREKVE